jgi:putative redox protein
MLIFLRRMQKTISEFEINATGLRKQEHPTGFSSILMTIHVKSPDVSEEDLKKVAALAEEKYCPVWSMIKGNVAINLEYSITK